MTETLLTLLLNSARDAIVLINSEGNITLWNKAAEEIFGYTAEEVVGKNPHFFLAPKEYLSKFKEGFTTFQALGTGNAVDKIMELTAYRKDNTKIYIELSLGAMKLENGFGAVAIIRDISDRKKLELELMDSLQLWVNTFNSVNDSIWILDENQTIKLANSAASKLFNLKNSEIIGRKCYEISHNLNKPIPDCPFLKAKTSLKRETEELNIGDKFFSATVDPIIENGEFKGAYHSIRDITQEKLYKDNLKESEEKFKQLADSAPISIAIFQNNKWVYANKMSEKISEYSKEELYNMNITDFVHPDDKELVQEIALQIINGTNRGKGREFKIISKSGKEKYMFATGTRIEFNKKTAGIISVIDITEKKSVENMLLQAQKLESIGRLAGGVAHDFNNILSVIMNYIEILNLTVNDANPIVNNSLTEIKKATKKAADLTSQLLAFARKQTAVPKIINLNEIVKSMLKMLKTLVGENIDIVFIPNENIPNLRIDPSQLDQILINLCANAKDAIEHHGKITIETNVVKTKENNFLANKNTISDTYILLSISDNGCGMDKKTMTHLFEPFYTTKELGKGTGLGLATIYGIIKQNEGFINVRSELGKGSSFDIYFPAYEKNSNEITINNSISQIKNFENLNVLLVEDNKPLLNVIEKMLQLLGINVISANEPLVALEKAKEFTDRLDLVITDVVMPQLNGMELVNKLKTFIPNIKVLYTSGYTKDIISKHGILDNQINFIQKPITFETLKHKVSEILYNKEAVN